VEKSWPLRKLTLISCFVKKKKKKIHFSWLKTNYSCTHKHFHFEALWKRRAANFSITASCALCYIAEPAVLAEAPTYSSPDKRVPVTSQGQQSHGNGLHSFRKGYAAAWYTNHNEAIRRNFPPLSISKNVSLKPSNLYLALWSHALMTSKDQAGKNTEWCLLTTSAMVWQENAETESNGLKKKVYVCFNAFFSLHFYFKVREN